MIAGIDDRVNGLGQHGAGAGDNRRDEFGHGDASVPREGGVNDLFGSAGHERIISIASGPCAVP